MNKIVKEHYPARRSCRSNSRRHRSCRPRHRNGGRGREATRACHDARGDFCCQCPPYLTASKIDEIIRRSSAGITSELTLAEALAPSKGRKRTPQLKKAYLDLMVRSRFIDLQPVNRAILYETVNLIATRATAGLKLPDAIHFATAIRGECRFLISGDKGIPVPQGMVRVKPDADSVADIIKVLE